MPDDGRAALRFRARDPRSLGRMLEKMLTDGPLRERLVAEAREHVRTFDWAEVARQTAAVYAELGARPAAART